MLPVGYLGVMIEKVPYIFRAQLGAVLPPGQGVMIHDVVSGSPAEKAGLKTYNVVVGYNDQKLYSAEQLSHLVQAEAPNTTVTLSIVHGGAVRQTSDTFGPDLGESAGRETRR